MQEASARERLRRMDTRALAELIAHVPALAYGWATMAKVQPDDLRVARRKSLTSLRSHITRDAEAFVDAMAIAAVLTGDADVDIDDVESIDAVAVVRTLARTCGPEWTGFLLLALRESRHPSSAIFAAAATECRAVIDEAREDEASLDGAGKMESDMDAGSSPGEAAPAADPGALDHPVDVAGLIGVGEQLLAQALGVADGLRDLAQAIEAGRAVADDDALLQAASWLATAMKFDRAGDVAGRIESLRTKLVQQRESMLLRRRELEELESAATTLVDGGHALALVHALLAAQGFDDLDSLRAEISQLASGLRRDAVSTASDQPAQVASLEPPPEPSPEPEPEPEPEPAQDLESSPEPEPDPALDLESAPEVEPEAEPEPAPDLESAPGVEPEIKAEPDSAPDLESAPEVEPEIQPEAEAEPDPAPEPEPEPELEPAPEAEPEAQPEVERVPGTTADTPRGSQASIPDLIRAGRHLTALLVAQHSDPKSLGTKALQFFAAAMCIRSEALQFQLPELALNAEEIAALGVDESRIVLAGNLRVALDLGYSPIGSLETLRERSSFEHERSLALEECVRMTMRGGRLSHPPVDAADHVDWHELEQRADELRVELQTRRTAFARASNVLHHLARDEQPLGAALINLRDLAADIASGRPVDDDRWTDLADRAAVLRKQPEKQIDHADQHVSTKSQRRHRIVGSPLERLLAAVTDVADLLERAGAGRAHRDVAVGEPAANTAALITAIDAVPEDVEVHTAGQAAVEALFQWIRTGEPANLTGARLDHLLNAELELIHEIPRDGDGRVTRPPTTAELEALAEGRPVLQAVEGFLMRGNREAAEALVSRHGLERSGALDDLVARSRRHAEARHRNLLFEVDHVLGRLRSMNDEDTLHALEEKAQAHRDPRPERRDLAIDPLQSVLRLGQARLGELRTQIADRVAAVPDQAARARIERLLEDNDEALAVEYLSLVDAGEELPTLAPPPGDDFVGFFPGVVHATAAEISIRDAVRATAELLGVQPSTHPTLTAGVNAWHLLREHKQGGERNLYVTRIADVLRLVGLVPAPQSWFRDLTATRKAGYATYRVTAAPIDASYIPSLGTQAHGSYDATLVWTEASPQRLLSLVRDEERTRAQVIFYFGTLSAADRVELRRLTTRAGTAFSPIVIDNAVVAWLSTQAEPGWKLTQRITLPFTTLNPYTPFAGGEVPAEVFVGRETERAQIVDPTGPMFVYGGRQLGKSALLRRVERASAAQDLVAVYLDLKSAGIGDAAAPDTLWSRLGPRLVEHDVLPVAPRSGWTADHVCDGIAAWLDADPARRFLLLLDEADNFLTADARITGATGRGGFPTLQRLKGLMEASQRRFKPVFAGLHQVQRFHDLPNTPVAHGGQDVLIGPLKTSDARQLVRDPMYALGFTFEDEETMWRLLLFTNYQASLIQIICEALITHMAGAATLEVAGGRMVITNRHVDEVYAKRQVRDNIAQRFRWTINLDARYRMIALVAAFRSIEGGAGHAMSPGELQDECEFWWSDGFARRVLSRGDFSRYLEEMVGLGVLQRRGERYALRSPNIVSLLGSRQSIETELTDAAEMLEVDYEYNPALNRRPLSSEYADQRRSPLADADLADLLVASHAVVGTPALGLDRVREAVELVAEERGLDVAVTAPRDLGAALRRQRKNELLFVEARTAAEVVAVQGLDLNRRTVVLVVPAELAHELPDGLGQKELSRWTAEALQSWSDSPFDSPALRHQLNAATGGWPELVERAMGLVEHGRRPDEALRDIREELASPTSARDFLHRASVETESATRWAEWFSERDGEVVTVTPASLEDLKAAEVAADAEAIVEHLHLVDAVLPSEQGWLLDGIVAEAALRLTG